MIAQSKIIFLDLGDDDRSGNSFTEETLKDLNELKGQLINKWINCPPYE